MEIITNFLDRILTPLRPKIWKPITPRDLSDDHRELEDRTKDIKNLNTTLGDEHTSIIKENSSLSTEHPTLSTGLRDYKRNVENIGRLEDDHERLRTRMDAFKDRVSALKPLLDTLHSQSVNQIEKIGSLEGKVYGWFDNLGYIRECFCGLAPPRPCPHYKWWKTLHIETRDITCNGGPARGYDATLFDAASWCISWKGYRVGGNCYATLTKRQVDALSKNRRLKECLVKGWVKAAIEYGQKNESSLMSLAGCSYGMSPRVHIRAVYNLGRLNYHHWPGTHPIKIYLDGKLKRTSPGYIRSGLGLHTLTIKSPGFYDVEKKIEKKIVHRKAYPHVIAYMVPKRR